jgi:hypothetical protein
MSSPSDYDFKINLDTIAESAVIIGNGFYGENKSKF